MDTAERPTRERSRVWILVAAVAVLLSLASLTLNVSSRGLLVTMVCSGAILVGAAVVWAIGRARERRRDFENRLADWAAERAVAQERLRIARDLHDLSSHGLGIITVRAAATGYLQGPNAEAERRQALLDIERVGRSTTTELRRMLGLLRAPGDDPAPLHPVDTLAELGGIVAENERHGLIIQLSREGLGDESDEFGGIGQSVQVAICAVVREGLTNVLRHAGPTTVRLGIARRDDIVTVVVDDDGRHPGWQPEPGAGQGLTGLRERVRAHGGALEAAPTSTGFRLRATLRTGEGA